MFRMQCSVVSFSITHTAFNYTQPFHDIGAAYVLGCYINKIYSDLFNTVYATETLLHYRNKDNRPNIVTVLCVIVWVYSINCYCCCYPEIQTFSQGT
jgi:hypothetical protein